MLIRNAHAIFTGRPGGDALARGSIRVEGTNIAAVGELSPLPGEEVFDANDCVVAPGWVNTHHHFYQSLLKAVPAGIDQTLRRWSPAVSSAFRGAFDEATFRTAVQVALAELLLSGCTSCADHHFLYHAGIGFDGAAIVFEEAERFGLRIVLCRGGMTVAPPWDGELPPWLQPEPVDAIVDDIERLPLHSHFAETADDEAYCRERHVMGFVEFCEEHGWLAPDAWFAHMVHLGPADIARVGAARVGMSHCPASNARLGSGIAPVMVLESSCVRVSMAVDGAGSNESADMLAELHFARLVHRTRGEIDANGRLRAPSPLDLVRWASSGGADVLGLETGRIAAGWPADLAVYRPSAAGHFGLHDPKAYPSKPIRIIVGYPPGSATATAARNYSLELTERLGQSVVIENRHGASGTLAAEAVARAAPDGYTLLGGTPSEIALNRPAGMALRYDPEKDLVPVALLFTTTPVIVASTASGHRTLADFVAAAKAKPGERSIASVNVYQQVLIATFKKIAGIKLNVIYYKGTALALTDVLGGQIDALVGYPAEMSPHVQAGRARALTLIGPRRNPFLPDTPLASEAGYRMPDLMTWGGFFVPAGTPAAIVERLNRETVATGESAELKAAIAKTGSELQPYTAREFRTLIEAEIAKWNRLVRESGVKVQ